MGVPIPPEPFEIPDIKWYFCYFLVYFKIGGPACSNFTVPFGCCQNGQLLKQSIAHQCEQGGPWCAWDPNGSFRITGWSGPYADQADCVGDVPDLGFVLHGFQQNLNHVIMEDYGFLPGSGGKSEINFPEYGNAYGFFADSTKNLKCHIRFDAIEISQVL